MASSSLAFLFLSCTRDRGPEADRHAAWWRPGPAPAVDILIATYNEEEAILERTIVGALAVEKGEATQALVTSVGFNQQVGVARVSRV